MQQIGSILCLLLKLADPNTPHHHRLPPLLTVVMAAGHEFTGQAAAWLAGLGRLTPNPN